MIESTAYTKIYVNLEVFHLQIYTDIPKYMLTETTCKLFDNNFNFRVKILSIVQKSRLQRPY
jgi:hypothetical protein